MEEILASIRRIISEDDAPAETGAVAAPATAPEIESDSAPSPALMDVTPSMQEADVPEEDVLELTDEAPVAESIGDLDVSPSDPDPFPVQEPVRSESVFETPAEVHVPEHPSMPTPSYDSLVGDSASASAASAFAGFASSLKKPEPADVQFPSGPTIDEMVRGLLRPMLKDWLDANLPAIVETQVRKEVERIARTAG